MTRKDEIKNRVFDETIELKDNAMLKIRPELFYQWDFEKNDELGLDIYKVTHGSRRLAFWSCEIGHSFPTMIKSKGKGCIYCSSRRVLIGFNDMWTTNPKLASLLADPEDGYKYMQFSHEKVDWKCPTCIIPIFSKGISDINIDGLSCSRCSDGMRYPEKVLREVLSQLKIDFINDTPFDWSGNRRYDFFIPSFKMIIEVHGGQHYNGGFSTLGGKSLEEEIQNDIEKKSLAFVNDIEKYIVIDARESRLDYIKNSILKSDFIEFFEMSNIDWNIVEEKSQSSISYECLLLWNSGCRDIEVIAMSLNIHREAVRRYLKQWSNLEKCDFNNFNKLKRKITQLTLDYELIKEWDSISDATDYYSGKKGNTDIRSNLSDVLDSAFGFQWMYKEDYYQFIETGVIDKTLNKATRKKSTNTRSVVKLNEHYELLSTYASIFQAARENDIKSFNHITSCCRGRRDFCGGFKWMYKEDFDNYQLDKSQSNTSYRGLLFPN